MKSTAATQQQPEVQPVQEVDPEVKSRELAEADLYFQEGVAALREKIYDVAVEQLAKSLELKTKYIDEKDVVLADLYFAYGRALLFKAQNSADVFGDKAMKKVEETAERAQAEEDNANETAGSTPSAWGMAAPDAVITEIDPTKVQGAPVEQQQQSVKEEVAELEPDSDKPLTEEDKETIMSHVKIEDVDTPQQAGQQQQEDPDDGDDDDGEEEESGEDDDQEQTGAQEQQTTAVDSDADLELAWQVLELARMLYAQMGEEKKGKLADVHLKLGEINMEADVMADAVKEFYKAAELFNSISPPDLRAVAEAYYFAALAYESISEPLDDGQSGTKHAISELNKAKKYLQRQLEADEANKVDTTEIKEVLQDITEKIESLEVVPEEDPEGELGIKKTQPNDFKLGEAKPNNQWSQWAANSLGNAAPQQPADSSLPKFEFKFNAPPTTGFGFKPKQPAAKPEDKDKKEDNTPFAFKPVDTNFNSAATPAGAPQPTINVLTPRKRITPQRIDPSTNVEESGGMKRKADDITVPAADEGAAEHGASAPQAKKTKDAETLET